MKNLSVIILTKNVENLIANCIDSVSFCDEIIVIDDYSSDRTAELAKHLGALVYPYSSESFAKKRNLGLKKARGRWILYLDVDERVSPKLAKAIQSVLERKRDIYSAYRLQRKNFYLGDNEWPTIEKLERLFKKNKLEEWYGDLHESPRVNGDIGDLDEGFIKHYTHQNLTSMLSKTIQWSKIEAELRLHANHPRMSWWRFFRVMLTAFYDSYIRQKGYKVGTAGLVESIFQAFSMFITYARLWELQENNTAKNKK
ncbi:MAG TPA: glycosyltransferase family 2 protein [Candidatus Sulfotelmatobacter sp.]|jgi:(heptosyl)LPS beta-1,4-glucosyltransferase|nr:glycosyltransferase family 2 protein [Candidatus Sulfotelmatobacter sp.]